MSSPIEESVTYNITIAERARRHNPVVKNRAPVQSNPNLEDWEEEFQENTLDGTLNVETTQDPSNSSQHSASPSALPLREEARFFDEDTYKFSVSPEPSPKPFHHWIVTEKEEDLDWDEYEAHDEAARKNLRKEHGRYYCAGLEST